MSWLSQDKHSKEEFERLSRVKRVCVSQTELRSTDCKNQVVSCSSTPPAVLRWPLTESSLTCWNSSQHLSHVILTKVSSEVRTADAERVTRPTRSAENYQRSFTSWVHGSRTSGELLLPVSRRPSHWEMISQRNNGVPSRIPNRISPWWFTWQTVALLLCSWILTHTMP